MVIFMTLDPLDLIIFCLISIKKKEKKVSKCSGDHTASKKKKKKKEFETSPSNGHWSNCMKRMQNQK